MAGRWRESVAHTTSSTKRDSRRSSSRSTKGGSSRRTSGSSRSGSRKGGKAVDRPFDPAILERARAIAAQYRIILKPSDDPSYVGHALELPGAIDGGDTPDAAVANVREAATTLVAYMLEQGRTPPSPASEAKRSEQVNVRLTPEEKLLLEEAAQREGFRGVSDYVRATTLASARH
jgi:predicted RNase H-like HicB family nuclease